jgi:STE24 endopeptidase
LTPLAFSTLFVAALAVSLALRYWLAGRQVRHVARHRGAVPEAFAQRVPLQAHQRAADYTVARVRLGLLEAAFGSAVLVGFTLLGGLQWLQDAWLGLLPDAPLLRQVLLVGSVVLIGGLLDLPMDWYRQFRLEQRFGFNRMSLRLWTADLLRGAAIGAALGLPLAAAALWLMRSAGQSWWLWVWALWIAFSLFVMWLYPSVIAPLFNRFEPLPPGPVRARVEALLTRCGFAPRGLFVMDGSRRSAHGNAYFTGFGRARRIVFFDTLLSRLDEDEIEAVLAHELGHFRLKHIRKRILLGMATSLAGLWLLGLLARQPWFYQGLGVGAPVDFEALALLLFFLALPVFTLPLQPLLSMLSRRHEFEADAFAARNARATALASALVKLYEDNASTLTPDPVHSAFHDSHPPAAQRIGRLLAA